MRTRRDARASERDECAKQPIAEFHPARRKIGVGHVKPSPLRGGSPLSLYKLQRVSFVRARSSGSRGNYRDPPCIMRRNDGISNWLAARRRVESTAAIRYDKSKPPTLVSPRAEKMKSPARRDPSGRFSRRPFKITGKSRALPSPLQQSPRCFPIFARGAR